MSAVPTIETAIAFWRAGRRREAELACRAALAAAPDNVDVLQLLGEIESACERHVDAVAAWRRVLERRPADAATHRRLANSLTALGQTAQAIEVLRDSLRLEPNNARALNNLGMALIAAGSPAAAIEYLEGALQSQPDYPIAYVNLGLARLALRDPSKALSAFDAAARLKPELARAHAGRGHALRLLGRPDAAVDAYERAIGLDPGDGEVLRAAGLISLWLNRNSRALQLLSASLELAPDNVPALEGRAMALLGLRRFEEAIPALAHLMSVAPTMRYAPGHHFHAQLQCCDWASYDATAAALTLRVQLDEPVEIPWSFMAYNDSPADHLRCARVFAADRFPPREAASPDGASVHTVSACAASPSRERIRLAYLSADFRDHAVAKLFARLAETHDRTRFEVTGVSFGPDDGSHMRARLQNAFDRFIDVQAMSDRDAAARLRDLKIDIAVELTGFTSGCRLGILAERSAPVQVNYLGYPGTLGASYVDYLIADATVIPSHEHGHYTEKIITMPDCYLVNDDTRSIDSQAPTRGAAGLPEQGFVFCCFNNSFKINPGVFDLWMQILRRVPGSVLWLAAGSDIVMRNLRHETEQRQVDPERLVFAPHLPRIEQHLARFGIADLFLDTLPYNAHATTCDALWAGLPVLTRLGSAFPGRVAASALQAVGLPELITDSAASYVDTAVALGNDRRRVRDLRMRLNDLRPRAALFDTRRFRLHLEYAYTAVWDRHRRGEPAAAMTVPPLP